MVDCLQLTQRGYDKTTMFVNSLGKVTSLSQESVNGLISESAYDLWWFKKKKALGGFFALCGCVHMLPTHI